MSQDGALFDMPGAEGRRQPRVIRRAGVAYARYRPRTRVLCDDCVRAIHERGQAGAPYPRSVRWRRIEADGIRITQLCDLCKQAREANDGKGT